MQESARIARGDCKDLKLLSAKDFDALLIPGGFGAAKNLCDWAFKGKEMKVEQDVLSVLHDFHANRKVIGATCISPIILSKVLSPNKVKLTLGMRGEHFPFAGAIDDASSFGCNVELMDVKGVCIDWINRVVTTPAYMQANASPFDIYEGMSHFVRKVTSLVRQN